MLTRCGDNGSPVPKTLLFQGPGALSLHGVEAGIETGTLNFRNRTIRYHGNGAACYRYRIDRRIRRNMLLPDADFMERIVQR